MKDDITRRAVVKAATRMNGVASRLKEMVPFGPEQVQVTPRELEVQLRGASGATVAQFIDQLGPDKALEILRRQRGNS